VRAASAASSLSNTANTQQLSTVSAACNDDGTCQLSRTMSNRLTEKHATRSER